MEFLDFFVEGSDDVLLIDGIMRKCGKSQKYRTFPTSQIKDVNLKAIIGMFNKTNSNYMFIADRDKKSIPDKRISICKKYDICKNRVVIVDVEIESWYAAGSHTKNFVLNKKERTENIDKELFRKRSLLMMDTCKKEIAADFDVDQAIKRNYTFKDFYRKLKGMINGS